MSETPLSDRMAAALEREVRKLLDDPDRKPTELHRSLAELFAKLPPLGD